jgi:hypothetical protein
LEYQERDGRIILKYIIGKKVVKMGGMKRCTRKSDVGEILLVTRIFGEIAGTQNIISRTDKAGPSVSTTIAKYLLHLYEAPE